MSHLSRVLVAVLLVGCAFLGCRSDSSDPTGVLPATTRPDTMVGMYQTILSIDISDRIVSIPLRMTSDGFGRLEGDAPFDVGGMSPSPTPTPSGPRFMLTYEDHGDGTMMLFGEMDGVLRHPFAKGAVSADGRMMAFSHIVTSDFFPPGLWVGLDPADNVKEATLQGEYHFVALSVETSILLDRAQVGRWTFDGLGSYTVDDVVTNDAGAVGLPISSPWLYTYGIPEEGLVTLAGESRVWIGSVMGDGEFGAFTDISGIPAPNFLLTLAFCVPAAPFATTSTLSGTYHFVGMSFDGLDFRSQVGTIEADGLGNLTGSVMTNEAGYTSPPDLVSATYAVGADGVLTLTPSGGEMFQGGVAPSGDVAILGGGMTAGDDRGVWILFRQ